MKNIPLAPKECHLTSDYTVFWISDSEVILEESTNVKGVPAEGSNTVSVRYIYKNILL